MSSLARHITQYSLVAFCAIFSLSRAAAQLGPSPPTTYEVQIDGESFQVEASQPPKKVESGLKKGAAYTLSIRLSPTQALRLNSIRMEYEMPAKVFDDKGQDVRFAEIIHDFGFSLRITDIGHRLDPKPADKLLDTLVDAAMKRYTDHKATDVKKTEPKGGKLGPSTGKWTTISYKNEQGEDFTAKIFVLSGEKYTVAVEANFRDHDTDDVKPWVMTTLSSIRPLH